MTANGHEAPEAPLLKGTIIDVVDLTSDDDMLGNLTKNLKPDVGHTLPQIPDADGEDSDDGPWENESLYEDALEGIGDEQYSNGCEH